MNYWHQIYLEVIKRLKISGLISESKPSHHSQEWFAPWRL